MSNSNEFGKFGKFAIGPGRQLDGELRIAGEGTSLYLRDDVFIDVGSITDGYVAGILQDLTKVSLIQCIALEEAGHSSRGKEEYHFAKVFPHFVLEGQRHLGPNEAAIVEVKLVLDDAPSLFYDFEAFGSVSDAGPHMQRIALSNKRKKPIPIGPAPRIVYFAGEHVIVESETTLGRIRAEHNPRGNVGGPRGVRIDNDISVNICPKQRITFEDAISRALQLLRFLELIIGRPQNCISFVLYVGKGKRSEPLQVNWSLAPSRVSDPTDMGRRPAAADLLLDPIRRKEEFVTVMRAWLKSDDERRDARERFHSSFAHQRTYTVERLVGAANMFDLLPNSAAPKDIEVSAELEGAKRSCKAIFKRLPESYERNSVLVALGRIGKASLKHKTRHRARHIVDNIGERFPELVWVLEHAVDCRNHYVHGSAPKFDYNKNQNIVSFLTDTLEFVFASAELIETGWSIRGFIEGGTVMSHPFGAYRVSYEANLHALKALCG